MSDKGKVLMIYTGGTIGMVPKETGNLASPLVAADWQRFQGFVPSLKDMPIEVALHEMTLIDSSDMYPGYWIDIARVIRDNYADYDGFVILHGTDTMTYTATGLSFLLENLDKPVILTGSQLPIALARNDAAQNLVTSLMLAAPASFGLPVVPEVCICFNNLLLRGNRSRKVSSSGYEGFATPNYPPLAEIGEHIKFNTEFIREPSTDGFYINDSLEEKVMMFDIFPGISPEILRSIFSIDGLKGVVFRTYGAGNAPTTKEFLCEIETAVTKKNLAIVNVTQCAEGMVEMGLYDASAGMQRLGVISGVDMTSEAALVKMMFLLGQEYDIETTKDLMQKDQRGEQSLNVFNFMYEHGTAAPECKMPPKQIPSGLERDIIKRANIRLDNVTLPKGVDAGEIDMAVFMNYPSANVDTDTSIPQCLGVLKKTYAGVAVNLILDCSDKFSQVLDTKRPIQVSIVSRNGQEVAWEGVFISVYTSVSRC